MPASSKCSTCGESHAALPTDIGWTLPDVVWAIPEVAREDRARFNEDLCELDGRFFIRCVLIIPFSEQPGEFGWGVWVEVSRDAFFRYVELFEGDARSEPMVAGTIANAIPPYEGALGLPVMVQFQTPTQRPSVHVPMAEHQLAQEQAHGMSNFRYHEILRR